MHVLGSIAHVSVSRDYLASVQTMMLRDGLRRAVGEHDTPRLYDWLATVLSYQGIADAAARTFMRQHGVASFEDIASLLADGDCPKLASHWSFEGCGYVRSKGCCNEPAHYARCPLPGLPLRNGSLNQMAFSLFLFLRDVCEGDLVAWIERRLASVPEPEAADYPYRLGQALIGPMHSIHGASDKVLNMALADLLLGAAPERPLWQLAGSHMVAIDSLVHNLLHRTGTLSQCCAEHAYGPACYQPGRCADLVRRLAHEIDASAIDPSFPKAFPRLVQHALWLFCAQDGLNICNGVQIDDERRCENSICPVFDSCGRVSLRSAVVSKRSRETAKRRVSSAA